MSYPIRLAALVAGVVLVILGSWELATAAWATVALVISYELQRLQQDIEVVEDHANRVLVLVRDIHEAYGEEHGGDE